MPDYAAHKAGDCRLRILQMLDEQLDDTLTSTMLLVGLVESWGFNISTDYLRRQIDQLAEIDAVTLKKTADADVVIVTILQPGRDHLRRRTQLPGVGAVVKKL